MSERLIGGSKRELAILPALGVLALAIVWVFGIGTTPAQAAVRVNYNQVLMANGQSTAISVTGTKSKVKWTSSKKGTVTVSAKGKARATLKAKKAGTATVRAKVGKKTLKTRVRVVSKSGRTLVAYMSWSGTTKGIAQRIQRLTGADIVQIKPRVAYTKNYNKLTQVAQKEQDNNARPALGTKVVNAGQYQSIVLGYPIWWGTEPMLIRTFLTSTDVSGKTIVPFSTSQGSGFSGSRAGIVRYAKGATVKTGRDLSDASDSEISNWLSAQGIALKSASSMANQDTGGTANQGTTSQESTTREQNGRQQDTSTTPTAGNGKTIVVYWSATGNTQRVANIIAGHLNATSYELKPAQPYTAEDVDYRVTSSRCWQEHNANLDNDTSSPYYRPALAETVPNWADYDTVYLGYPIWWAQAPNLLYTFVESTDFTGKTVIPFCTSMSSGLGSSATRLSAAAKGSGKWRDGHRFGENDSESAIISWVDSQNQ